MKADASVMAGEMKMRLEPDLHRDTWAEVDLDCIAHNVEQVRQYIGSHVRLMAVVKADAYGHGALPVAATALDAGAEALGVATFDEALDLRKGGIQAPILVFGYVSPRFAARAAKERITLTVVSVDHAKAFATEAESVPVDVHLKFDTGMGRLGLLTDSELTTAVEWLGRTHVNITGAFTHFAKADSGDKQHAVQQLHRAQGMFDALRSQVSGTRELLFHAANSAAIIDLPQSFFDMVRLGISLYGVYPSNEVNQETLQLKQALRLYTRIVHVKSVPKGTPIGYGGTFITGKQTQIATLPIGYADGLPRSLSNNGSVLVRGVPCPIIGRVCMDQTMIDVSSVSGIQPGERVVVYDDRTLANLSTSAATIPYELLCAVSKRVPRIYLRNGRVEQSLNLPTG